MMATGRDEERCRVMQSWENPAKDYASKMLVSVPPETPLTRVQEVLDAHQITAVPVIDARGALCGIVSSTDLLRVARIEMQSPRSMARMWPGPHLAKDVMRGDVVTIDEAAPLRDAAAKMVERRIHRVVVTRAGRASAVLSTRDAMRAILEARVTDPVSRVMQTDLATVDIGESIDVAVGRLTDESVRGLVVVDEGFPVGVFTQREAIQARALPAAFRKTPVEQIMSYETICHDAATPLYRVAGQALGMNVRRILVVDGRRLVGIATGFDLARYMTL